MDPIADMFVNIVNASRSGKSSVFIPHSKVKMDTAKLLAERGYIKDVVRRGKKSKRAIEIVLSDDKNKTPNFEKLKRISKPSRRVYSGWRDLQRGSRGRGLIIVSTPKGILDARDAVKQKVGGEVIGRVW